MTRRKFTKIKHPITKLGGKCVNCHLQRTMYPILIYVFSLFIHVLYFIVLDAPNPYMLPILLSLPLRYVHTLSCLTSTTVFPVVIAYSYSEKVLNRRSINETKVEYTTEQIRLDMAENEALYKPNLMSNIGSDTLGEMADKPHSDGIDQLPHVVCESKAADVIANEVNQNIQKLDYDNTDCDTNAAADNTGDNSNGTNRLTKTRNDENVDNEQTDNNTKGSLETKSKKRRRKRSMMKKKSLPSNTGSAQNAASVSTSISNTPRKNSSSSSLGSMSTVPSEHNDMDTGSNVC